METSLAVSNRNTAYHSLGGSYLQATEQKVLDCVRTFGASTTKEIANRLGYQKSGICGRIKSLQDKFLIKEAGSKKDHETGVTVTTYTTYLPLERRHAILNAWERCVHEKNELEHALNQLNSVLGHQALMEKLTKVKRKLNEISAAKDFQIWKG